MSECACFFRGIELVGCHSGADFVLERNTTVLGVLNALDGDGVDGAADACENDWEEVHEEAWVDTGAEHGD